MVMRCLLSLFPLMVAAAAAAADCSVTISNPPSAQSAGFKMGAPTRPDGTTLTLDTYSFRLNGKPWTPVMGEFHYTRYPDTEWREELLKMKGGGIDIVATYAFWIHHEEVEGEWEWSGCRDLRKFLQLCDQAGLKVLVRCGPWGHGEVRNGGQPDWLLKKGWKLRSDDSNYLAKANLLYRQIAKQLTGLLWKDGGPVLGIQFENEYGGPASHLLTLKRLGREAGLDVPLYTRTGWPPLATPMPFGEVVPLYGVYAEGFWDRELTSMPGNYWAGFHFSTLRTDANIANEALGRGNIKDADDVAKYPYLTCEIGGGMMSSYHRRIQVYPADIDSTTLVKLGSGSTSPGYYMYHGGVNPEGKLSTMNESQATLEYNDLPVKTYDFQAPLGQYGQIGPQYHSLRRLHLFLHEWGAQLAGMSVALPDQRPAGKDDVTTLRWAVRSDGRSGFVFVNNYQRLQPLSEKAGVQFKVNLPGRQLIFPSKPVTVAPEARFLWPFNLDLGSGVRLAWASARPVTAVEDGNVRTVFFAESPAVKAEFAFESDVMTDGKKLLAAAQFKLLRDVKPGRSPAIALRSASGGVVRIVLLNEADSLALWKGHWLGSPRVFLSKAALLLDGEELRMTSADRTAFDLAVVPAPGGLATPSGKVRSASDGVFVRYSVPAPKAVSYRPAFELLQPAGPARDVLLGKISSPVAAQPVDADFAKAAVWRIKLPKGIDLGTDPLLRLHYAGDVARVTLNGKLITDDFYNGNAFDVGLRRHAPDTISGELQVAILPLRKDAPIYLADSAKPDFGKAGSLAELRQVTIIPRYTVTLLAIGTKEHAKPASQNHTLRYTNPITRDPSQSMRDQIIVKEGNRWYMTGTSQPIWDGPNPGVRLMVSDDLLHWRDAGWLIDAKKLPDGCPYKGRFYAPETRKINGKFYLVVNSGHFPQRKEGKYWEANHKMWIFSAADITGPYSLITSNGLAVGDYANDGSLFEDDDGRTYLYCCTYTGDNKGLHQAEIDLKTGKLVDEAKGINGFTKAMGPRDQGAPDWMAAGIEGPYVIKRHGFYWMFFSSYTRGYEIGVLKAGSPLGPWHLSPREPILGTRKHEVRDPLAKSEGYDFVKYEDSKDPYVEVGHNGVFEGPDGKDWICCLYWLRGDKVIANPHVPIYNNTSEQLGIEPLHYEKGIWKVNGPTWTEQVVTWDK